MTTGKDKNRASLVCNAARAYLLSFEDYGITGEVLDHYLEPEESRLRAPTLAGVYERLLESAQNSGMRPAVIGGAIGGIAALRPVLFDFDPRGVSRGFPGGWETVLDAVEGRLHPRNPIRRAPRSIWPQFCRSIISGASFLSQFADATEFYSWVDVFDRDDRLRPALPMLLSREIDGFGFPLACDFLKELGYLDFGKPDVHVKAILSGLGFVASPADDYRTFKAIVAVAREVGRRPYYVDKLLWLVGSGFFYDHPTIGRKGRVPTDRRRFIEETREMLDLESLPI